MKQRAGVIILREDKILLMYRRKPSRGEYYIIPGGGVETGESFMEAAIREAREETGLEVSIARELFREENDYGEHQYFLTHPIEGEPILGGEEAEMHSEHDFFRLDWIPLSELATIEMIMPSTKALLLEALAPLYLAANA